MLGTAESIQDRSKFSSMVEPSQALGSPQNSASVCINNQKHCRGLPLRPSCQAGHTLCIPIDSDGSKAINAINKFMHPRLFIVQE